MTIPKRIDDMSRTDICFSSMIILNFIVITFLALVPALTQIRVSQAAAFDFLGNVSRIPKAPAFRVFTAMGCYLLLVFVIFLKKKYFSKEENGFLWLSFYEIFLAAVILVMLDMSYNGIVFLIVADYLYYLESRKNWMGFLALAFLIYLFCNYYLVTIFIPFNSFEVWASYYRGSTKAFLLGIKTFCEILNIMFTLLFITLTLVRNKEEKKEIRELNVKLKYANDSLRDANEQLHQYALKQEQMGEMKERNRLAREIHDTLGHLLTGISVGVDAVNVLMDIAPDAAKDQLITIGDMARNGLNDVRRSVRKLKPDALETKSIDHAILDMVNETSKTTGAKIYFVSYGKDLHYEADEEETIYRLVQEGTTNSLRHGEATEIWIRLDKADEGIEVTLTDNGSGSEEIVEGFGLTHMRERVEILGGEISFRSNNGFQIRARIPVRHTLTQGEEI